MFSRVVRFSGIFFFFYFFTSLSCVDFTKSWAADRQDPAAVDEDDETGEAVDTAAAACESQLKVNIPDLSAHAARFFSGLLDFKAIANDMDRMDGNSALYGGFRFSSRNSADNREVARQALAFRLNKLGLRPEIEPYANGANVYVEITGHGRRDEVIEFGANFDARDLHASSNSAGVAVLLELASLFVRNPPRRTIRLVFFDSSADSEKGGLYHASAMAQAHDPRDFIGALMVDGSGHALEAYTLYGMAALDLGTELSAGHPLRERNLRLAREIFYQLRRLPVKRGLQISAENASKGKSLRFNAHKAYWKAGMPALSLTEINDAGDEEWRSRYFASREARMKAIAAFAQIYGELAFALAKGELAEEPGTEQPNEAELGAEDLGFTLEGQGQTLPPPLPRPQIVKPPEPPAKPLPLPVTAPRSSQIAAKNPSVPTSTAPVAERESNKKGTFVDGSSDRPVPAEITKTEDPYRPGESERQKKPTGLLGSIFAIFFPED